MTSASPSDVRSRGRSTAAIVIAIVWTIPTLGLFVTSFRPGADSAVTGWWTVFVDPSFTLDNYGQALTAGGTALTLGESFINSLATGTPVYTPGDQALEITRIVDAIYESSERGAEVKL